MNLWSSKSSGNKIPGNLLKILNCKFEKGLTQVNVLWFISLVLRRGRRTSRLFSKQEQDGRVVLSIGLLLLPRVSAGKFLHTYLAPFLGVGLESRRSKASVLLILIAGLILAVGTLSSRAQLTNKSYI